MRRALEKLRAQKFEQELSCIDALARVQRDFAIDFSRARARCGFARGHLLDVVLYLPGGSGDAREQRAAEELTALLLGEELFEHWVGSASATPAVRGGPLPVLNANSEERVAFPLALLREAIESAIAGLKLGLSAEPAAEAEDWVLFELSPEPAPDYAGQDDLLLASTRLPELKKSFLRGEPFFSGRFSSRGELFLYLKYESSGASSEARLEQRSAIEAELARALRAEHGAIIGAGLGIRYGYLDLALSTANHLDERILPALREAGVPQRAWLLFCDAELEREWIGVHPDTPEPFWG